MKTIQAYKSDSGVIFDDKELALEADLEFAFNAKVDTYIEDFDDHVSIEQIARIIQNNEELIPALLKI